MILTIFISLFLTGCSAVLVTAGIILSPPGTLEPKNILITGTILSEDGVALNDCELTSSYFNSPTTIKNTQKVNHYLSATILKENRKKPADLIIKCVNKEVFRKNYVFDDIEAIDIGTIIIPWSTTIVNLSGWVAEGYKDKYDRCYAFAYNNKQEIKDKFTRNLASITITNPSDINQVLNVSYPNEYNGEEKIRLVFSCNMNEKNTIKLIQPEKVIHIEL